jgi:ornithine cyclodeaminase/alanine dehydrogenase-like protein (mu-crystallin family)
MQRFRLLTEDHVKTLLPMPDLIAAMEAAVARFSSREVLQPVRTVLSVGPQKAYFGLMPAYIEQPARLGAKLVTVFGENPRRGLPSHLATIVLLDPDTGALIAVMDGRYITEARTAAVSAVSARHLANQDASTMAIIGSGVQARSHLEAYAEVRELLEVRVWSPQARSRERFVEETSGRIPASIRACASAEEALDQAELIVLATSSATPVIEDAWVSAGAHVVSVGACRPDQREIAPELIKRSGLYVDSKEAALVESGDVVMGICEHLFNEGHIIGELGDVVLGRVPGRIDSGQITVFKSLGMAVEDVVSADLVLRKAIETGAGTELSL